MNSEAGNMVTVNGEPLSVEPGSNLAETLERLGFNPSRGGFAVAVDGEVLPRSEWALTALRGGESVEIVRAVQGG